MTAFGRAQQEERGYRVTVEVRALNSRNLDVVLRFPKNYLELEDQTRKQITQRFQRGRVEVYVLMEAVAVDQKASRINVALARHYWEQLQQLARELPGSSQPSMEHLLRFSDIFESAGNGSDTAALDPLLNSALIAALDALDLMRIREGQTLSPS